ncbi:GPW/gp25 family protein [Belliella kenyensis]|uniref:GPW/gp25 family protein n=1 Tax=Belliella kenyensis TaxID=1472724 RepID=A0ABV8EKB6_9BACT|nr:GPW/gp25 family protein [Belliella kenyensis]MCH7400367.1 GPW/gp25 family protein [Belliella kenyensis]MDN3604615.1 GPW/gp25 family protein [Belliella kenyensis]
MSDQKPFLGRGWTFPPTFQKQSGKVNMLEAESDIESSLEILLSTSQGERLMHPNFGCNLQELLFNPLDRTLITYISDLIKTAILYYEPRIAVQKIDIYEDQIINGKVIINIAYLVRATNSRRNMVFPFYKNEGIEI